MQHCIADIREWMLPDRLRLNAGRSEFIIIGTRQQLAKVTIDTLHVGESVTTPAGEVKHRLKMDTHINNICKAAFFHLFDIGRIRKFLSITCTKILENAFVTSCLDYCNSFLYGLPNNRLHKLQRVQNAAARLIRNVSRFDHITPSQYSLHWLPIIYRIQLKFYFLSLKL